MDVVKSFEAHSTLLEQEYHREALQLYGEKVLVRQVLTVLDLDAGRTGRCTVCGGTGSPSTDLRLSRVYEQSGSTRCLSCFGTGFDGGFYPEVHITNALIEDATDTRVRNRSGEFHTTPYKAQFPWTPHLKDGDLVVRVETWKDDVTPAVEAGRFTTRFADYVTVHTGPRVSTDDQMVIGYTTSLNRLPPDHMYFRVPVT